MPTKKLSTKAPKRRLLSRIKVKAPAQPPAEEASRSPECEIFALAVVGGDGNRATVYERLAGACTASKWRFMKQQSDDFKSTYARLKAWRDAIRGSARAKRKKQATPFRRSFSPKSEPRQTGKG